MNSISGPSAIVSPTLTAPLPPLPLYPAALTILGHAWHSRLAHDDLVPLAQPEVHLGRLEDNDVVLSDPTVSRHHAVIRWTPSGYELEDLRSTGGTYIQGQRIVSRAALAPGQTIRMGATELHVMLLPIPSQIPSQSPASNPASAQAPALTGSAPAGQASGRQDSRQAIVPLHPAHAFLHPATAPSASRFGAWVRHQVPNQYWRVFLAGLALILLAEALLSVRPTATGLFLLILFASALVPVTLLIYCFDKNLFADIPDLPVALTFLTSATAGIVIALVIETLVGAAPLVGGPVGAGVVEELVKLLAVIWFLPNKRLRGEIDGLILGATAGAGFATSGTLFYAVSALEQAGIHGAASLNGVLLLRGLLAVFGQVTWTAIIAAAIWRDRGPFALRLTGGVALAFAIALVSHILFEVQPLLIGVPVVIFDLLVLRFFIREAVTRQKMGSMAPPPPPLGRALLSYFGHLFARPLEVPQYAFAGYGAPATPAPDHAAWAAPTPPPVPPPSID